MMNTSISSGSFLLRSSFYGFIIFPLIVLLFNILTSNAAINDWAEGIQDKADGATRDYYNRAGRLEWENYLGDWHDASDTPQGSVAYSTVIISDDDTPKYIEWDVTELVQQWLDGTYQNQGFFMHAISGAGPINFRSREYAVSAERPQLVIQTPEGVLSLAPEADTYLEPSTYRSMGDADRLVLRLNGSNVLLRFDLDNIASGTLLTSAVLRMFTYAQYGGASMVAGVFRCAQGERDIPGDAIQGIAAGYTDDQGIQNNSNVIFATGFESDTWTDEWSSARGVLEIVDEDAARKFSPLQGKALCATIPEGENTAMSVIYKFQEKIGLEPEEIYFRYYLRFGDDWNQTVFGGKLPGISGTYGTAGWGGRKPNGTDGWSARGAYYLSISGDNPLSGTHPIGTYCYHADQLGTYGDSWWWSKGYNGYLKKNQWYCIEQYVKMNTLGQYDGIIKAWVDGRLAFEKTDLRFRTVDRLKIEQIWMNVYHGGTAVSPYDQHIYVDNVVIARQYIGPMNGISVVPPDNPDNGGESNNNSIDFNSSDSGGGGCFVQSLKSEFHVLER